MLSGALRRIEEGASEEEKGKSPSQEETVEDSKKMNASGTCFMGPPYGDGFDLGNGERENAKAATPAECCDLCKAKTLRGGVPCLFYTFVGGTCWFKSNNKGRRACSTCTTGSINGGPNPAADLCIARADDKTLLEQQDTDFEYKTGQDLGMSHALNAVDCCKQCTHLEGCYFFSWFPPGDCWLKTNDGGRRAYTGAISGHTLAPLPVRACDTSCPERKYEDFDLTCSSCLCRINYWRKKACDEGWPECPKPCSLPPMTECPAADCHLCANSQSEHDFLTKPHNTNQRCGWASQGQATGPNCASVIDQFVAERTPGSTTPCSGHCGPIFRQYCTEFSWGKNKDENYHNRPGFGFHSLNWHKSKRGCNEGGSKGKCTDFCEANPDKCFTVSTSTIS